MNLNQALQTKFPHLEVSCLKLSEVQKDNETKRIDSEFFWKTDLIIRDKLVAMQSEYLSSLVSFNSRYSQPEYNDLSSLKIINSQYIRNDFIDYENAKSGYGKIVPKEAILINSTGVGTLGRVNINLLNINFSIDSHINVLITKDKDRLNPCYLMIFLQTKYGQSQINRYYSGTSGQIEIYPRDFNNFLIPLLPMDFQLEIQKLVKDSHFALEQSKELYKEAQNMLYIELGLNPDNPLQSILDFHPTPKEQDSKLTQKSLKQNLNISIRTLKESLGTSGRLDSEYYQSKYDKIESYIKNYKEGFNKLELIEIKDSNFTPKAKEKYRYIELANIGANGSISVPLEEFGKDLPTRARRIVKEGDLIVSSIEGSLSSCALITQEFDNCIVSTGFYILKSLHINSETLLVLFKSQVFQEYLKKFPSGTILTAISKDELQNILIPKIDFKTQEKIATLIQESFALRAKAKALLEEAKIKVETAINVVKA